MIPDGKRWFMHHGDCIPHMQTMLPASVDCAIFSPPFPSLYAYTSDQADIGNNEDLQGEAKLHLGFFYKQLARVVKPGRVIMVHVSQIPGFVRSGKKGMVDFRGMNIRIAKRAGLVYEYDWLVRKNPQSQAIRTHSHNLLFVTLERDRAISRGAMGDYLIKFLVPGDNQVPIDSPCITRDQWIQWAEACWDVRETDTLNNSQYKKKLMEAVKLKGEDDTKHICPLQLPVIERLVKLYSNPDEIVFSPFAGIGSEGYQALQFGRKFYGIELKKEYHDAACLYLQQAEDEWQGNIGFAPVAPEAMPTPASDTRQDAAMENEVPAISC